MSVAFQLGRLVAIVLVVATSSCSNHTIVDAPKGAKLTYSEVSTLAIAVAKQHDVDLAAFDQPVLRFDETGDTPEWMVYFQMKSPAPPGGHFMVVVDDVSRKTKFLPGE